MEGKSCFSSLCAKQNDFSDKTEVGDSLEQCTLNIGDTLNSCKIFSKKVHVAEDTLKMKSRDPFMNYQRSNGIF